MTNTLRSLLLATLLLLFAAAPALAQSDDAEPSNANDDMPTLATSLTVGYLSTDFTYAGSDTTTAYDFSGPLATLLFEGQRASLALSYGTADSTGAGPALRTLGAELWFGGDVYLFRNFLRQPLSVFVPIRFNGKYRYVSLDEEDTAAPGTTERPALHVTGAGLGAGAGVRVAPPVGPSFLTDNLVGQASLVFSPGLMGNVGEGFDAAGTLERPLDELKLRWATDFSIEVQFKRLLGGRIGVTAGYTLRTVSRSPEKPSAFADIVDTFVDRSDFVEVSDEHVFRVGITW